MSQVVNKVGRFMLIGAALFAAGQWTAEFSGPAFLLPLGVIPAGFHSLDYYPLLPWASLFLCGAALGKVANRAGSSTRPPPPTIASTKPRAAA